MFIETAYASTQIASSVFESRMEIWDFILLAISIVVLFAWVFSIWYILWGGILLILSWWKDEKIKPAINSIRYSLIWLIVIVLSIFVFPKIAWMLWMDVTNYASPDKIFTQIRILWDKFFWNNSSYLDSWNIDMWNWWIDSLPSDFSDL